LLRGQTLDFEDDIRAVRAIARHTQFAIPAEMPSLRLGIAFAFRPTLAQAEFHRDAGKRCLHMGSQYRNEGSKELPAGFRQLFAVTNHRQGPGLQHSLGRPCLEALVSLPERAAIVPPRL